MDPDTALDVIRTEVIAQREPDGRADVERLVEHIDALDGWLTQGGFLPSAWESPRAFITEGFPGPDPDAAA